MIIPHFVQPALVPAISGIIPDEIDKLGTPSMRIEIIRKGGSLPFRFDRGDLTIEGWICNIRVKKFPDDGSSISRLIETRAGGWPGLLTSAETDTLSIGTFRLIGVLTNATTDEEEQILRRFNITESWAA